MSESAGTGTTPRPPEFDRAVRSLRRCQVRPEVSLSPVRAPQRLAPFSHAVAAEVVVHDEPVATGRLVLLSDPDSRDAWDGTLRLVSYASAEIDAEMACDPMLSEVGWSWLLDALATYQAAHTAVGGTVTQTSSSRFGDIAGPAHVRELELRASWTPLDDDLRPHVAAWIDVLCTAAGLPPPGVAAFPPAAQPARGSALA
jgi:hypothetical protein